MRIYTGKELTDKLGETRGFKIPFSNSYIVGKVTELNMRGQISVGQYVTIVGNAYQRAKEVYNFRLACEVARRR